MQDRRKAWLLQASEGVGQAFSEAAGSLRTEGGPLSGSIVVALADRCSAGLAQLRGITAMYRMSARPSPTRYTPAPWHDSKQLTNVWRSDR